MAVSGEEEGVGKERPYTLQDWEAGVPAAPAAAGGKRVADRRAGTPRAMSALSGPGARSSASFIYDRMCSRKPSNIQDRFL